VTIQYVSQDLDLDGTHFTGSIILAHELFHALDFIADATHNVNYLSPIDTHSAAFNQNYDIFPGEPHRFYMEVRATMIENQYRRQSGAQPRQYYGGINLTNWLNYSTFYGTTWK